ncbi:response regulator transcription factor [Streptomyces xiaopingdaonensis]|uniref:response regulator transcription factor n=1 Tax=Streptomyces xiaopingdaonensis TaxID=1565415 RepID=UPI0003074669|nr:response regulator transcription factor [Streptomyces xiaopingdaonensis]
MTTPEPSPTPVRLLLADDDALVRSGLRLMLGGLPDAEIVAEAADGAQVQQLVERHRPDVVLMDIRMPGTDGLAATEALQRLASPPQVVVLTTFDADAYVLRALRAGAAGFLLKDTPPPELARSVRAVAAGEPVLSPAVARKLIHRATAPEPEAQTARREGARRLLSEQLTDREHAVAVAVGRGLSNAEIAAALYMGVPTVKTHVSRVLAKLDLGNRVQIALLVHDAELLDGG